MDGLKLEIMEKRFLDMENAILIDGFPSVGLVSTIVANYIVDSLKLEQIGVVDSIHFPTVSVIRNGEPLNPVRIYAGSTENMKIVVFICEFQLEPIIIKALGSTMLDWAEKRKISLIITPEGLISTSENPEDEREVSVSAIGSTAESSKLIPDNIEKFEDGVITGVTGVLLNEGKKRDMNVLALLADAYENIPDARAAARIIEVINEILNLKKLNPKPLYNEAEYIEKQITDIRKKASTIKPEKIKNYMYG